MKLKASKEHLLSLLSSETKSDEILFDQLIPKSAEYRALKSFVRADGKAKLLSAYKRVGAVQGLHEEVAWIGRNALDDITAVFETGKVPASVKVDASLRPIISWAQENNLNTNQSALRNQWRSVLCLCSGRQINPLYILDFSFK